MNRSLKTLARRMPRPPRRALMRLLAVTGAVALVFSGTPPETTGAWFARQQTVAGNTLASSQLQPLLTVNATSTSAGNNISWNSALTQQWANSNNVKSDVSYTLSRINGDGSSTNIYTGADTSFFQPGAAPSVRVANPGLLTAGCAFTSVVANDGTVWSWGANSFGQLGNGSTAASGSPVRASGLANVVSIDAGCNDVVALDSSGQVWVWGAYLQYDVVIGFGSNTRTETRYKTSSVPLKVQGIPTARSVSAGARQILVAGINGTVWSWTATKPADFDASPVQVDGLSNIVQVSAGRQHALAIDTSGQVWSWGVNAYGSLGNPGASGGPQVVQGISGANSVSAGFDYSLATTKDGRAWAWGGNRHGQLGIGNNDDTYSPALIVGLSNVTSISAGNVYNSMATDSSGKLWAWGTYASAPNGKYTDKVGLANTPQPRNDVPTNSLQVATGGEGPPASSSDVLWTTRSVAMSSDGAIWDTDQSWSRIGGLTGSTSSTNYCSYGGTPASEPTCPISGNVTYSVSYTYKNWSSSPRTAVTASTASLVSSGVVLGPNNKCLDIAGNSSLPGTAVDFFDCNGVSGQKWTAWSDGTLRANGKCLDIAGNSSARAALVEIWTCTGGGGQVWVSRGDGTLFNPRSGKCLDDPGNLGNSGVQLQIWDCLQNIPTGQKWTFVSSSNVGPLIGTSGKCVDTYSNTPQDGKPIDIYTCDSTAVGQQWFKLPDGTLRAYNMCMSVVNDAIAPTSKIELRTCTPGSRGQQWAQQADLSWKNPASGLCLDNPAGNTTNGTQFQLWDCNGYSPQKWPTVGTGNPVLGPGSTGKCVDVAGNNNTNGNAVQLWDCNGAAGQNWSLAADGTVRAFNKCLSIYQDGRKPESKVILFDCNGGVGQQWVRLPNASLRNPTTGLCLDDPAGNTANGTQLQIYDCNGFDTQRWTFI